MALSLPFQPDAHFGRVPAAAAAAESGHSVVIAYRSIGKAERAAADLSGDVAVGQLDLADLASVRAFAESVETVDVLVNDAGVMGLPMTRTTDGFEAQIGTNHLGHFALTWLLGDRIKDRVISVASAMYLFARIHFDDLLRGIQAGARASRSSGGPSDVGIVSRTHGLRLAAVAVDARCRATTVREMPAERSVSAYRHLRGKRARAGCGSTRSSRHPCGRRRW
jgi:NAD(P)-dependent dehydrogenase (short-subunit alcohol dehydrogenase family)